MPSRSKNAPGQKRENEPSDVVYEKVVGVGLKVENLPKRSAACKDLRRIIDSFELEKPVIDIQKLNGRPTATITCVDKCQQDYLVKKFQGYRWKDGDQFILRARPVPIYQRRARLTPQARELLLNEKFTLSEKLSNQVTPLWQSEYPKQLELKTAWAQDIVRSLLQDAGDGVAEDVVDRVLDKIVASPQVNNYRSKVEFTFGLSLEDKPVCGFLLGMFRHGITMVVDPCDCVHVSGPAKSICVVLNEFIKDVSPDLPVYDRATHVGCWRLALVRTHEALEENMVVIQYSDTDLSVEAIDSALDNLRERFSKCKASNGAPLVTCLLAQRSTSRHHGFLESSPCRLLYGKRPFLYAKLLEQTFRVSPSSFFQVNAPATELLYSSVLERVLKGRESDPVDRKTVVLDLCCGTGTIGMVLAAHVSHVIGVEMVENAVRDAELNASINGLQNKMTFLASKVENALSDILKILYRLCPPGTPANVVAIVDPPRAGLHPSVVQALLSWTFIDKVVYVSCDAQLAMSNFKSLVSAKAAPFSLTSAQPFDLFPHTKHCEIIMEFERPSSESPANFELICKEHGLLEAKDDLEIELDV